CSISSATRSHSVTPAVAAGARQIAVPRKLLIRFMSAVIAASLKLHHRPLGELSNNIDNSAMTDTPKNNSTEHLQQMRQDVMAVLASSSADEIDRHMRTIEPIPAHEDVRAAASGLVMLRGRIGGDGAPFNFGEATVTRAAVRLESR